jgi:hypothetical protein
MNFIESPAGGQVLLVESSPRQFNPFIRSMITGCQCDCHYLCTAGTTAKDIWLTVCHFCACADVAQVGVGHLLQQAL